jgi:DNA-binding CsgD family transcriptional regulator
MLLLDHVRGPIDAAVCDQIVAESHGNPLALLELPRSWDRGRFSGGFGLLDTQHVGGKVEQSYERRLRDLPSRTQLVVLVAAAEPLGDPGLLQRAAEALDLSMTDADPAIEQGILELDHRVRFAHPLARSAAYRAAAPTDRRRVHRALAEATDATIDPDRRAWHRGQTASAPDEEVAVELEQAADRAQQRGGASAAAALLRQAVTLTRDPTRRVSRTLAAAQASMHAGAFQVALELCSVAEAGVATEIDRGMVDLLRGQIAFASNLGGDAPPLLLNAARQFEPFNLDLARQTYLDAWIASLTAGQFADAGLMQEISLAARSAPTPPEPRRPSDVLLEGLAASVTEGRAAAVPALGRAAHAFADEEVGLEEGLRWGLVAQVAAAMLWDDRRWHSILARQLPSVREAGLLAYLPIYLSSIAISTTWRGDFATADAMIRELHAVSNATGSTLAPSAELFLACCRGSEADAAPLVEAAISSARTTRQGVALQWCQLSCGVLYNGLGEYEQALQEVKQAVDHARELHISGWAAPELIEAATRTGATAVAAEELERLTEATSVSGNDWGLGIRARSHALVSEGETAERLYQEALTRLCRTRLRPELARTHLLYGEWLRREGRRADARRHLRTAHDQLTAIGMQAFAERARIELLATGEKVRKRTDETRGDLTAQELQIALLARDGLSNPEIGARLFLSPRTVEWHLRKVFTKLAITSRRQLRTTISDASSILTHA